MKITFILPAIGKKPGQKYIGTWKMEPLTIAVLKALTPEDIETELWDDRIELIDYNTRTDLVMITVETYTAMRSYAIAAQFRNRGIPVIMGGYHVTLFPEEAAGVADSIIIGNAENVYAGMLRDFQAGKLQPVYNGLHSGKLSGIPEGKSSAQSPAKLFYADILPDKSIFSGKKYLPVSLVETGRGCSHNCDFCAVSGYYGRYCARPHDLIMRDIETSRHKYHFFVDDNLLADKQNALSLFEKITPCKIKWAGQGTLSVANDPGLLRKMKQSGCELILIGFESLSPDNLRQMNKSFNLMADRDEWVKRIHDAGIGIYATFVFGYDYDTEELFEQTLEFAERHRFYTAAFNHLLPFPGTRLYEKLKAEQRLLYDKWWLEEGYHYGELAFEPRLLSAEQISRLCRDARKAYSAPKVVRSRGLASMRRSSPLMWSLFWAMNLRLGEEIDDKMYIPIGANLDELPK